MHLVEIRIYCVDERSQLLLQNGSVGKLLQIWPTQINNLLRYHFDHDLLFAEYILDDVEFKVLCADYRFNLPETGELI